MSYIWRGNWKQKYEIEKWEVPGIEVLNSCKKIIKVNISVRFKNIFFGILDKQINSKNEKINIIFHYLAELDRKSFINSSVIERELILEDIKEGRLGEEVKQNFEVFTNSEKEIILNAILESTKKINQYRLFEKITKKIFHGASKLYYFESCDKFFIYLGAEQSIGDKKKIEIIKNLFWDITSDLEIFYDKHFGVIGTEETMVIGEIKLI